MPEEALALTSSQRRFASDHDAHPGIAAATGIGVFFYHRDGIGLERWLVSRDGRVLDSERFHTCAA